MILKEIFTRHGRHADDAFLHDFIKEEDLYYSIYPLHAFIREKFNAEISLLITPDLYENEDRISENLIAQVNLQIRNNFIQYLLVHELNVADAAGLLEEGGAKSKLYQFIMLTGESEWIDYLFSKYKYLDRRLLTYIDNLFDHLKKVLARVSQNFGQLTDFLKIEAEKITGIKLFLGDLHQNGQSVVKVDFNSKTVLYKPRSQALETELGRFVQFLNLLGVDMNINIPAFLDYDDYSWAAFVKNDEVDTIEEIKAFFRNHGKAIALFHFLGSVDLIHDNVIAKGAVPAFIDLECVLRKTLPTDRCSTFLNFFEDSVVATGILPVLGFGDNLMRDYFGGALHSRADDKINTNVWENQGTADIKLVTKAVHRTTSELEKHLPIFKGKKIEINLEYQQDVLTGFQAAYDLFVKFKKEIIAFIHENSLFSKSVFRVIPHPTAVYEKLGKSLITPEAFGSLTNERELKRIMVNTFSFRTKTINRQLASSIINQLNAGDIPFFCAISDSRHLYTHNLQVAVWDYFPDKGDCSQDIVDRIKNASDRDRDVQKEIISGTINFFLHIKRGHFMHTDPNQYLHLDVKRTNNSNLLNGAATIADYLIEKSIIIDDEINWLAKTANRKDQQYEFSPMTYDLYEGLTGIAFFLLYAHKYINKPGYLLTAEKILENGKMIFRKQRNSYLKEFTAIEKRMIPLSPFYYPSSLVFLMEHFVSFDKKYLDANFIEEYLDFLEEIVEENENCDILSGLAGLLELLLTIKHIFNKERLTGLIHKVTDQILKNAKELEGNKTGWQYFAWHYEDKPLFGGYAHGTSGIALTLLRASKEMERVDLVKTASSAIDYDRSLFCEEQQLWLDLRDKSRIWDSASWCHGSSGIGMSRALLSDFIDDAKFSQEIEVAVANTLKSKTESWCLCHGKGSDWEILRICNSKLKNDQLELTINKGIAEINDRVLENSFQMIYGDGTKMEMLGLFLGLSGIGYLFLRFYDWENMPSVLCLESSKLNYRAAH